MRYCFIIDFDKIKQYKFGTVCKIESTPTLWADSLPAEPQGKPENTGVGSLIPSPTDVPNPGIELGSPALQVDSLPTELSGKPQ